MNRIIIIFTGFLSFQMLFIGITQAQGVSKDWATEYMNMYLQAKFDQLKKKYLDENVTFLESSSNLSIKGVDKVMAYWKKTFADIKGKHFQVNQVFSSGASYVVVHGKARFDYRASALGLKQEGYIKIDIPMSVVLKVRNKRIIHQADYTDSYEFMKQVKAQMKKQ